MEKKIMAKLELDDEVLESETDLNQNNKIEDKSIAKTDKEIADLSNVTNLTKKNKEKKEFGSKKANGSDSNSSLSNEPSSDVIDTEIKINKNLKLHNEMLHKSVKRKAKVFDKWINFILEIDEIWNKANKSESIDDFQQLIQNLENPPNNISKNEIKRRREIKEIKLKDHTSNPTKEKTKSRSILDYV